MKTAKTTTRPTRNLKYGTANHATLIHFNDAGDSCLRQAHQFWRTLGQPLSTSLLVALALAEYTVRLQGAMLAVLSLQREGKHEQAANVLKNLTRNQMLKMESVRRSEVTVDTSVVGF